MAPASSVTVLPALGVELAARYAAGRGWDVIDVTGRQALTVGSADVTVRYRVRARRPGQDETLLQVVVAQARDGSGPPRVWAFPDDPDLPGLAAAAAGTVLGGQALDAELLRWRPGRRAVFAYRRGEAVVAYVKVLPPDRAQRLLAATAVAPPPWSRLRLAIPRATAGPGVVATDPVPGSSLRQLLAAGLQLPAPNRILALTEELAAVYGRYDLPRSPRGSVTVARARRAALMVNELVPDTVRHTDVVLAAVEAGLAEAPIAAGVVHGDLYENQIFVVPDGTLGLIDLDDLGLGDPAWDAACLMAHLRTLAGSGQVPRTSTLSYRDGLRRAWLGRLGLSGAQLDWREAYALLLLATAPFRVLRPDWPDRVRARAAEAASLVSPREA